MTADAIFWLAMLSLDLIVLGYALARVVDTYRVDTRTDADPEATLRRLHEAHLAALQSLHQHRD
ncbi:hypothetical protein [Arthrobacter woluwensis]|uniref:hypothetical protein n=1 Tax=Arthrobacter woluwensis TaxID=156980 RepID=UPI0011A37231|nr:hypothetical protein [Arthrobacter woluwensis]